MGYRYYVTDLINGEVLGTDDLDIVHKFVMTEDAYAVDVETGEQIMPDMSRQPIHEAHYPEVDE